MPRIYEAGYKCLCGKNEYYPLFMSRLEISTIFAFNEEKWCIYGLRMLSQNKVGLI